MNTYDEIASIIAEYRDVLFGISDTKFSVYERDYRCALVIASAYKEMMTAENYNEEKFEELICEARQRNGEIFEKTAKVLDRAGIPYLLPQESQTSEETLEAPFSFKFAAVRAGLGWIGKNGVLVTAKYGPRVRLGAMLIDADFPLGVSTQKSRCPSECRLCTENCPYHALKGQTWDIQTTRNQLIDYYLCNKMRSRTLEAWKRKDACGLCMVCCPFGIG